MSTGPGNLITLNTNAPTTGTYTLTFATGVANTTYTGASGTLASLSGSLPIGSVTGWPSTVGTGTLVVSNLPAETPPLSTIQPFQYTGMSGSTLTGVTFPTLPAMEPAY